MVLSGTDLFVANEADQSVTELNASTGALVRVLSAPKYEFDGPVALALRGDDLFVANIGSDSLTEVPV
jgi:hypothetical protein